MTLPFFPPQEPDSLKRSIRASSERLGDLWDKTFEAQEKVLGGFWDQPPRERLAFYEAHDPALQLDPMMADTMRLWWHEMENGGQWVFPGGMDEKGMALPPVVIKFDGWPKEVKRMLQDWASIAKRKESRNGTSEAVSAY